ncbi:MAG: bifunctional UDP-N-acetylglucosamine diphosphorylase/glucosamine-1-phosphate N-acetyltransferase GlmU [Actinomycetota bacterium]|nr:bifunctional UDP-N-acetylglucosamine diphosphorylase/glucosamine-1-phosphate N-acetyltransferase GlmU [Actinomycetota bacterium]
MVRRIAYDLFLVTAPVVVILAAGQGTRMRSATPKLLHSLCGRPLLAWQVAAARAADPAKVVVVDNPQRRLAALFDGQVAVVVQAEQRGTADAVRAAADEIDPDGTVIVLNGDLPLIRPETIAGLTAAHERQGAAATMLTAVLDDPTGYGRVVRAPDGTVERVVETKAGGDASAGELRIREVNTGIFAFDGGELLRALARVGADNAQGELYLPDVLPVLREDERTVAAFELVDPEETLQVNDRQGLASVRAVAQRRIHERHMRAGVTIVDPLATVIDIDVEIGADTEIAPFSSLHGTTTIGEGSMIGPHTTLVDACVGDGATILHAYVKEAEVGDRVSVGPFAYLRPGTRLQEGSKVGTFVEVKNSSVGPGSKVPHLSYIGDTDIGEQSNIGAGTITANYDGYRKHRTKIGARVKVSVDTAFIAPVQVGDDSYTGAGSVISKDIPDGALGVARAHQRNIEGYSEQRRQREQAAARDDAGG